MKITVDKPEAVGLEYVSFGEANGMYILHASTKVKWPTVHEFSSSGGGRRDSRGLTLYDPDAGDSPRSCEISIMAETPEEDEMVSQLALLCYSTRYGPTYIVIPNGYIEQLWDATKEVWEAEE